MKTLRQQASSHEGSGIVQATAFYAGSTAEGHIWRIIAKVNGKRVYSDDQYKTGFIGAGEAAQRFADYVYGELYSDGASEPTTLQSEVAKAMREEMAGWSPEEISEKAKFDEEIELFGFAA